MRLYKNVKLQVRIHVRVCINQLYTYQTKITKYNGKTKIDRENELTVNQYKRETEDWLDQASEYVIDCFRLNDACKVPSFNYSTDVIKNAKGLREITRTSGEVTLDFISTLMFDFNIFLFGKLYLGKSDNLEECFETADGKRISEVFDTEQMAKDIKNMRKDANVQVHVYIDFDDDVQLLSDDAELMQTLYQNKGDIYNMIQEENYREDSFDDDGW